VVKIPLSTAVKKQKASLLSATVSHMTRIHSGDQEVRGSGLTQCTVKYSPWQAAQSNIHKHTRASVTKQYNLVLVEMSVILQSIEGLSSHWPCVTDLPVYITSAQRPMRGKSAPSICLFIMEYFLYLL